jgi:SPP1 gp7 family putative phage head morphogenesis protein
MPPTPDVVKVLQDFRKDLGDDQVDLMTRMADHWEDVERRLRNEAEGVAYQVALMRSTGRAVTPDLLMRNERWQQLLMQAQDEQRTYSAWAARHVERATRDAAEAGIEAAADAIAATAVDLQFNRLPISALENLIGLAGDGSPLYQTLRDTYGSGAQGMLDELIAGVAMGHGPKKMARDVLRAGFSRSLNHMMLVARTETNRIYRVASLETYRTSGVVQGYYRLAAKSTRTCLGCLAMDGEFFKLDVPFDEHPNGRCSMRPAIIGAREKKYETGTEWFERQDDETKLKMLGPGRMELYERGVAFDDFATRTYNRTWGGAYVPRPIKDILGGTGAVRKGPGKPPRPRKVKTPKKPSVVLPPPEPEVMIPSLPEVPEVPTVPKGMPAPAPKPPPGVQGITFRPNDVDGLKRMHKLQQERWTVSGARKNGVYDAKNAELAEELLKEKIPQAKIRMRVDDEVVDKILVDGRFKTQFETRTSNGSLDTVSRANAERFGLGIPTDIEPKRRPVYGYLHWAEDGENRGPQHYGNVIFEFKDDVKHRTTFTVGDSLWPMGDDLSIAEPMLAPTKDAIGPMFPRVKDVLNERTTWAAFVDDVSYIEAQIYEGASLDDVARVLDPHHGLDSDTVTALREWGIEVLVGSDAE